MPRVRDREASGILAFALGAAVLVADWALVRATKWATEATWESEWLAGSGDGAEGVGALLETAYHGSLLLAGVALALAVAVACGYTTARRTTRTGLRLADAGAALAVLGLLWILVNL